MGPGLHPLELNYAPAAQKLDIRITCVVDFAGHGVGFTREGKLVREATGYEQHKLKPHYPASGSPAARAEPQATIGANRKPTDFSDEARIKSYRPFMNADKNDLLF